MATDSIRTLFENAMRAQNSGQPDLARSLYAQILERDRSLPEVHYQLGRLEVDQKRPAKALDHLRRARKLKPSEPAIWRMTLEALLLGRDKVSLRKFLAQLDKAPIPAAERRTLTQVARTGGEKGLARTGQVDPADAKAVAQLIEARDFQAAEARVRPLIKIAARQSVFHAMLGAALAGQGKVDEAVESYRTAVRLDPDYLEGHLHLGEIEVRRGRYTDALEPLERALALGPRNPFANKFGGIAFLHEGRLDQAEAALQIAHSARPEDPEVVASLGETLLRRDDPERAATVLSDGLKADPDNITILRILGAALHQISQVDAALAHLDRAVALAPDDVGVRLVRADVRRTEGDFAGGLEDVEAAIALAPDDGGAYGVWAASQKVQADAPYLAKMQMLFDRDDVTPDTRVDLAFALAKAMEDIKAHDRVFPYLNAGNRILSERFPWSEEKARTDMERFIRLYDRGVPPARPLGGDALRPIFVTGLPRSGTTLTEQIIASHSAVTGGGELGFAFQRLRPAALLADAESRKFRRSEIDSIAEGALEDFRRYAPDTPVITDKAINSFQTIGLFKALFPECRIVVVRRDPRDNCLSMFKNKFRPGSHRYTTDLSHLARYTLLFEEILGKWRDRCPDDFYEIRYEELTADPEAQSRQLIDFCGLPWEDACLDFHKSKRQIRTLSFHQARQPMYRSSVAAWERYRNELQPLIEGLRAGGAID